MRFIKKDEGYQLKPLNENYPPKTYTWEEIKDLPFINKIDVLVDGEFIQELKDEKLKWKGSSNQRVINVKETLKQNKVILHCENY